jgi:hypothetical protein
VERVVGVGDSNQRIEDSRVMTRSTWERWFVDFVGSKRSSKPYLFTNPSPRMLTDQHSSCMVPLSSCLLSISEPYCVYGREEMRCSLVKTIAEPWNVLMRLDVR